ncbi:hypothetical protein HMPREF1576_00474 [Gardnerella pickettii JCP7719]|uniref:Uncharacterized protein n=1 Tax=Gardnerella pickettii JCP7719 TaxID=1261061 RepID=S4H4Y6_9BIFI|nr:hypothetical protein HMPREF1576_00474 [Gardnerella pickettii JCP7719]
MLKLHLHTTLYANKILCTNMFQRNRTTNLLYLHHARDVCNVF